MVPVTSSVNCDRLQPKGNLWGMKNSANVKVAVLAPNVSLMLKCPSSAMSATITILQKGLKWIQVCRQMEKGG